MEKVPSLRGVYLQCVSMDSPDSIYFCLELLATIFKAGNFPSGCGLYFQSVFRNWGNSKETHCTHKAKHVFSTILIAYCLSSTGKQARSRKNLIFNYYTSLRYVLYLHSFDYTCYIEEPSECARI